MKKKRHAKILELIKKFEVETQEDLLNLLREEGFVATQATISRDIRELKLIKELNGNGKYVYAVAKTDSSNHIKDKSSAILAQAVISFDYAMNMVCVKCHSGMAGAACAAIDTKHWEGLLGTLAGDDTIFVLCKSEDCSKTFVENLENILNVKNA